MSYEPEIGQAIFGQPFKPNSVSNIVDATLTLLREELNRVMLNLREDCDPFGNSGSRFDCDELSIHSYSWDDDEQEYNFWHKKSDIKISWYKYLGRGMSANVEITPVMASEMLDDCIRIFRNIENGNTQFECQ